VKEMKICKCCGDKFDPNQNVQFDVNSEDMAEEISRELEKGEKCFDCIFENAFYNESMKGI
jgi:hypothetical protein